MDSIVAGDREWIPYQQVDFSDESIKCYHIDTRDFHCLTNDYSPHIDLSKTIKYPQRYFHTPEEIKALIDRYFTESGGNVEWRMFSLIGEASHRTSNWQLKYIRIYRLDKGLLIYNEEERFIFPKSTLAYPVAQKHLNAH